MSAPALLAANSHAASIGKDVRVTCLIIRNTHLAMGTDSTPCRRSKPQRSPVDFSFQYRPPPRLILSRFGSHKIFREETGLSSQTLLKACQSSRGARRSSKDARFFSSSGTRGSLVSVSALVGMIAMADWAAAFSS